MSETYEIIIAEGLANILHSIRTSEYRVLLSALRRTPDGDFIIEKETGERLSHFANTPYNNISDDQKLLYKQKAIDYVEAIKKQFGANKEASYGLLSVTLFTAQANMAAAPPEKKRYWAVLVTELEKMTAWAQVYLMD